MVKLEELAEQLMEPLTRENWQKMVMASFAYNILRWGVDDTIYPYREVIVRKRHTGNSFEQLKVMLAKCNVDPDSAASVDPDASRITAMENPYSGGYPNMHNVMGAILEGYDFRRFEPIHREFLDALIDSSGLIFSQRDGSCPKEFLYEYVKRNWHNIERRRVARNLSYLVRYSVNLMRYGVVDERFYGFVSQVTRKKRNYDTELDPALELLLLCLRDDNARKFFSVLLLPSRPIDQVEPMDLIDELVFIRASAKKEGYKESSDDNVGFYYGELEYDVDPDECDIEGVPKFSERDKIFPHVDRMIEDIGFVGEIIGSGDQYFRILEPKPITTSSFSIRSVYDLLHWRLFRTSRVFDRYFLIESDLEYLLKSSGSGSQLDFDTFSRRVRILKRLRVEGRIIDYAEVTNLANINVPNHIVISSKGVGGTSNVYEGVYDRLPVRSRAVRIFDLRNVISTSLKGLREEYGDFRIFERGMGIQEALAHEYDFVVSVHDWGRLSDGRYYSIEELVDSTLEDELNLPYEKRCALFAETFRDVAEKLHMLHANVDLSKPDQKKFSKRKFFHSKYGLPTPYRVSRARKGLIILEEGFGVLPIVHRDIKLANIARSGGKIKILDFQTAVFNDQYAGFYFCGTRSYAAPETISSLGVYSPLSDIYSLGVCMYRYLTGEYPTDYGQFGGERESFGHLEQRMRKVTRSIHNEQIDVACRRIPLAFRLYVESCLNFVPGKRMGMPMLYNDFRIIDEKLERAEAKHISSTHSNDYILQCVNENLRYSDPPLDVPF